MINTNQINDSLQRENIKEGAMFTGGGFKFI